MNDNKNVNKQCMEAILQHITKLICLTEFENIKDLYKLVDMSTSISAQLIACDNMETDNEYIEECTEECTEEQ